MSANGTLWVVATPIGNLEDLGGRARRILGVVPVIAAEDTRVSRKLVPPRDDPPRWITVHEHNEERATEKILAELAAERDVALLSDAGTPLISDPGYRLVAAAHARGFRVSPVPGPCAAIAALSAAGLPTDRFLFEGFLPARSTARKRRLEALADVTATLVFYIPARDLRVALEDLSAVLGGQREGAVARELTKRFETIRRGRIDDLLAWAGAETEQALGEAVVLVAGQDRSAAMGLDVRRLARELAAELPPARAAKILSRVGGVDRKTAFALVESEKPGTGSGSAG